MNNTRTTQLEKVVAELLSKPLMRENVFHSAKFIGGGTEKEVCDILLLHKRQGIVISIKRQDVARTEQKTAQWLRKTTPKAVAQLQGAFKTITNHEFWCEHPVAGRRMFRPGDVLPCHSIALTSMPIWSMAGLHLRHLTAVVVGLRLTTSVAAGRFIPS